MVAEVPRLVLRQEGEALHDWVVDVGDHERRGHDRHIVRDDRVNHVVDSIEEPEDRLSISIHAISNLLDHPFRFLANLHCATNSSVKRSWLADRLVLARRESVLKTRQPG